MARNVSKRHRGRRESPLDERKEGRTQAQCSWHGMHEIYICTYVCMYRHSAAAEAVTLIAVFSNSKEEELLPVPSVGTRGRSRASRATQPASVVAVWTNEKHGLSGPWASGAKEKEAALGGRERKRKMHEGPRLITRELTRRASSTTSSTWQPA